MSVGNGNVPMFKMRPLMAPLLIAVVVLLLGALFFVEGHRDPGDLPAHHRSTLVLAISVVIAGVLIIISTGRMWFKHLWHDRYRKNRLPFGDS